MLYTAEILDRTTGELVEVNKGNWVTVSELGKAYGVGPRHVRAILHHMGLVRAEGRHGRYRLAPFAVVRGYGKRVDKPKRSKWPFDVISPDGQRLIAEAWASTLADMQADLSKVSGAPEAGQALKDFKQTRKGELTTKQEVSWLRFHHPCLSNKAIAQIVGVSPQLVGRYVTSEKIRRAALERQRDTPLVRSND